MAVEEESCVPNGNLEGSLCTKQRDLDFSGEAQEEAVMSFARQLFW